MSENNPGTTDTFRGKISVEHVGQGVAKHEAMDLADKEELAEKIAQEQPALFASFLAQHKVGASYEKMEFLLNILFVCYPAMKESGHRWPVIAADEVDASMTRYVESVQFGMDLDPAQRHERVLEFVAGHPEKALLAYVQVETANWLRRASPEESDRYVMLAAVNLVNSIGHAHAANFKPPSGAAQSEQ